MQETKKLYCIVYICIVCCLDWCLFSTFFNLMLPVRFNLLQSKGKSYLLWWPVDKILALLTDEMNLQITASQHRCKPESDEGKDTFMYKVAACEQNKCGGLIVPLYLLSAERCLKLDSVLVSDMFCWHSGNLLHFETIDSTYILWILDH